jgi:hypothetical protein
MQWLPECEFEENWHLDIEGNFPVGAGLRPASRRAGLDQHLQNYWKESGGESIIIL